MPDLDLLREIGARVRRPSFDDLIETRRRRTAQGRVAAASATAVVAVAVVGALVANGGTTRTDQPPVGPSETPSATPTSTPTDVDAPAGQRTIAPDVEAGDVHGYDELATVTNRQPDHVGDTYLETTVTAHIDTEYVVYDCQAHDVPTWIAYADGDLVSDSAGGAADGWTYRECGNDPLSLEVDIDLTDPAIRLGMEQKTARMFALAPPPAGQRECLLNSPSECAMPDPIAATDAEFGFRIYEHAPAPLVLQLLHSDNGEPYGFEALSIVDGTAWLIDRAVVAAPRADRLVVDLPASDTELLVDVYDSHGPGFEGCVDAHEAELPPESPDRIAYEAAVAELCYASLRLLVDGVPVSPSDDPHRSGHFMRLGAHLAPGVDHQVVVEVAGGDPRTISYAVVLRNRTETP